MSVVEKTLADMLSRNWWMLLLRGLIAIAFGVLIFMQPAMSLTALILLFGIYALADGMLSVWTAVAEHKQREYWWLLLIGGLLSIAVGIMTFMVPGITALVLLFFIAIRSIVMGVIEIVLAIHLRKVIKGEWLLILGGLLSIAFGIILMAQPGVGALAVLWIIATYAILFGILITILSFKARSFGKLLGRF